MTPKSSPAVSVVIPAFNRAYCLGEALESVISQTFSDFELIVVDDGSSDETASLIQKYPQAQYIGLNQNGGVSKARNRGIREARGRWICFLDSDDLWTEKKLQAQMREMEENPGFRAFYTDEIWIRKGVRVNSMNKHRKYSGDIFLHCLPLCIVSPSSVMLERSLLEEMGGFDESLPACEDYDLWLRIAAKYPFHFIPQKLIVKRGGHPDQLSARYWGMDRFRVYALDKLLRENSLDGERRQKTADRLIKKCETLIQGFKKRGKVKEERRYGALIEKYASLAK